ncbi:MAG: hypothetical protein FGM24_00645 [Candidatus Kapabacteria bacterium]|nr:hypothetical protein [Candidatus Kapabacteria bacterium]
MARVEGLIADAGIPLEVYMSDGMESSAFAELNALVKHAKVYDDETGSVSKRYRVSRYPFVLIVAPTGVVRFAGLFATSSFDIKDFSVALYDLSSQEPFQKFRGPVALQARVVGSIQVQSGAVGSPTASTAAYTAFDSTSRQVFVWDFMASPTAYILDSLGAVAKRVDMSKMFQGCKSGTHYPRHWDARGNRVLGSNYDSKQNKFTAFWFNIASGTTDTVPLVDYFWGRRRGGNYVYSYESESIVFSVKHVYGLPGDPNPAATMYIHSPTLDTFYGKRSDLYDRVQVPEQSQSVILAPYRNGWIASQVFTDTLLIVNGIDLSTRELHVPIPEAFRVPYEPVLREWAKDPDAARNRATRFSVLSKVFHDPVTDRIAVVYRVPSSVLQGHTYEPPNDHSNIVVFYDVETSKVLSTFELPEGAIPLAAHGDKILCSQLSMIPAQLTWFTAPVQQSKTVSTGN